jgi:PAS domain S-box-containing protein
MKKLKSHTGYDSAPIFHGQRLLEVSFDGIWAVDAQLRTRFVNRRMAKMLGYSSEEMAGRSFLEFMFPEDIPAEREAIARRRLGISEEFEIRYRRKDGSDLWARVSTAPIFSERGEFEGAVGIHSDVTNRRREEQALRKREAELNEAERVAQLGSWQWAPESNAVLWSEGMYRIVGRDFSLAPVSYRELSRLCTPESGLRFKAAVEKALATGEPYKLDLELIREDGVMRWVIARGEATSGADGRIVQLRGTFQDITERKQTEEALRISEERMRFTLEAANLGTWEWDMIRGTATSALNREGSRERAPGPFHGTYNDFLLGIHPQDRPAVIDAVQKSIAGDGKCRVEYRELREDGGSGWIESVGQVIYEHGHPTRMTGVCADITERKSAEEAKLRLAAIVESSDDPIISKDLNGIITSWNAAANRMFGYSAEEAIGKSIMMLIPPELQEEENVTLSRLRAGERIEHFETQRVRKNGERLEVSLTISPIKNSKGVVIGASKIARDITQRKRTEEALRISEKIASVGRLAATVAHEINNPLESVVNLVYLARTGADDPSRVMEYLSMAEEELARIAHLTKQTLGFYREQAGIAPVRTGELLRQLIFVLSPKARNKRVNIDLELINDPEIRLNAGEIRQLFANLLSNSIDACSLGGSIRVRVSRQFNHRLGCHGLRIAVADNGTGIKPADRERLFQPFFTTKKDVGTGLGLWVCKEIVDRHSGRITLRSDATPGRSWTVISVFLPTLSAEGDAVQKVA